MGKKEKSDIVKDAEAIISEPVKVQTEAPELRIDFRYGTLGGGGNFMFVGSAKSTKKLWKDVTAKLTEKFGFDPLPVTDIDLAELKAELNTKSLHVAIDVNYKFRAENFSIFLEKDDIKEVSNRILEQVNSFVTYVDAREDRNWETPTE